MWAVVEAKIWMNNVVLVAGRLAGWQAGSQSGRQAGRQADRQRNRQLPMGLAPSTVRSVAEARVVMRINHSVLLTARIISQS